MNRRIRRLSIGLMLCYVLLFASLHIPQVFRQDELNANPSNTRQTASIATSWKNTPPRARKKDSR